MTYSFSKVRGNVCPLFKVSIFRVRNSVVDRNILVYHSYQVISDGWLRSLKSPVAFSFPEMRPSKRFQEITFVE